MSEQPEQDQIAQEAYVFLYPLVLMDITGEWRWVE
jgi:hypothetical protein